LPNRSLFFFPSTLSYTMMWLKTLCRVPLGPFTITVLHFRVLSTFSGMSTVWLLRIVFILTVDVAKSNNR
jgi:hypothetical protein